MAILSTKSPRRSTGLLQSAYLHRIVLTVMLAFIAITFSLLGWLLHLQFESPRDVVTLVAYVAGSFAPGSSLPESPAPNLLVAVGRGFGLAAAICSALLIGVATMGQTLSAFWTRNFRRGHAIVVGETALAKRVVRILKARGFHTIVVVTHARAPNGPLEADRITGTSLEDLVQYTGLSRASTIVVDADSDAATLSIGHAIWMQLSKNSGGAMERLALRVADPLLADATTEFMLPKTSAEPPRPSLFDENQIMAQTQLRQLPLFRIAGALGQKRVHALIFGFGDLGEKLLDQVMLTSVAGKLAVPAVTVVDRDAETAEARFRARRPGVANTLGIRFVKLDVGREPLEDGAPPKGLSDLLKLGKICPFTAIFVALSEDSQTLRVAQLLRRLRARQGLLLVPLIYSRRAADAWPQDGADHWDEKEPEKGFFAMGLSDDDLAECLLEPESRQKLAKLLHETYRKDAVRKKPSNAPWDVLHDTYRRASFHAADHLPAKLWSLGITPECNTAHGIKVSRTDAVKLENLLRKGANNPQVYELARIEHERWMVERKLDGWHYGPERNDSLLIHPLLLPWSSLQKKPIEVKKDSDQVLVTLKQLVGQ